MSARAPFVTLAVVALVFASGCESPERPADAADKGTSADSAASASDPAEEIVLARVGGEPVTQADLERVAAQTMGPGTLALLDAGARKKLLQSLVLNRAMAQQARDRIEPARRRELDAMVEAYRENLLAQEFVRLETQDVLLTGEKLRAYYDAHPEQFGQKAVRRYELLKGVAPPAGESTTKSLELLGQLRKSAVDASFGEFARRADVRGAGITFFRGDLTPGLFAPRIQKLIQALGAGERSSVLIVDRVPFLARVTDLTTRPAAPFAEVENKVFERVRAVELKAALERLEGRVLSEVEVEYVSPPGVRTREVAVQQTRASDAAAPATPTAAEQVKRADP